MRLDSRVAMVIGGGDYVGHALAVRLAQEGARVALIDLN